MASGIYDVGGGKRVTIVSPDSAFVGKYAPDGSWNVVVNTSGFGLYWKNGALRINPSSTTNVYNSDGSYSGVLTSTSVGSAIFYENYKNKNPAALLLGNEPAGLAWDAVSGQLYIKDPTTPANNYLGDANGKLTYAAPSTKWIFERDGVLRSGTTLRCEYNPATGQPLGVRIESQRTNLVVQSEFPNGLADAPTKANVVAAGFPRLPTNSGIGVAADGIQAYAYKTGIPYTANQPVVGSFFVQIDDGLGPPLFDTSTPDFRLLFQSFVTPASSVSVEALGSGLYRVAGAYTPQTSGTSNFGFVRYAADTNRQRAFRVSGYQLEVGSSPSSYIPTTTAQVTRADDVITLLTSLLPWNAAEWTVYGRVRSPPVDGSNVFYEAGDGTATNRSLMNRSSASNVRTSNVVSGVNSYTGNVSVPLVIDLGFAHRTKESANASAVNGSLSTVGTIAAGVPVVNRLWFGRAYTSSPSLNGHIKSLVCLPRGLSDAELIARSI